MAETERRTARSVLAYERGAAIARRLTLFSVLIGILALAIGGGVVVWAQSEATKAIAERNAARDDADAAKAAAEAERASTTELTALNKRLIQLGSLVSALQPDDSAGASAALKEIGELVSLTEGKPGLQPVALSLQEMRIGIFATTGAFDAAIDAQRTLNAAEPASAGRVLDLAILQCRAADLAGARQTLREGIAPEDAALLTGDDRLLTACGNAIAALGAELSGDAPLAPIETGAAEPGRGPASVPEAGPAADKITKVFLHVRREGQRASAVAIASAICEAGYRMPGIEVVSEPRSYPTSARVIYYYANQADAATAIARKIERLAADLGLGGYDVPFDARLYRAEGLPEDRVEIWFGETAPASAATADKAFSCKP